MLENSRVHGQEHMYPILPTYLDILAALPRAWSAADATRRVGLTVGSASFMDQKAGLLARRSSLSTTPWPMQEAQ